MLTDQELNGLRNLGNESEEAADEIVQLRSMLADCKSGLAQALNACNPRAPERLQQRCFEQVAELLGRLDAVLRPSATAAQSPAAEREATPKPARTMRLVGIDYVERKAPKTSVACNSCSLQKTTLCLDAFEGAATAAFGGDCQTRDVVYVRAPQSKTSNVRAERPPAVAAQLE